MERKSKKKNINAYQCTEYIFEQHLKGECYKACLIPQQ